MTCSRDNTILLHFLAFSYSEPVYFKVAFYGRGTSSKLNIEHYEQYIFTES